MNAMLTVDIQLLFGLVAAVVTGRVGIRAAPTSELQPRLLTQVQASMRVVGAGARRPTVAVVLGGGGLRGFAHIGALQALEEAGIKPDIVVGTSAGAVVGAVYASGMRPGQIAQTARNLEVSSLVDWTLTTSGVMRGENLVTWINSLTGGVPIEKFPVRFAAVATDLESAQAVLLDSGAPGRAIQASAAVPGINVPVPYRNGYLIDGGVASLVPVRFARAMGADYVIAVDIYCQDRGVKGLGVPAVISHVMRSQSCLLAAPEMAEADVLIAPPVSVSGMSAKEEQDRAIQAGYDAARVVLSQRHISARRGQLIDDVEMQDETLA